MLGSAAGPCFTLETHYAYRVLLYNECDRDRKMPVSQVSAQSFSRIAKLALQALCWFSVFRGFFHISNTIVIPFYSLVLDHDRLSVKTCEHC